MQDLTVNAAAWVAPDFARTDRGTVVDTAPYEIDQASLAQFEALLPLGPGETVDATGRDEATPGVGGVGGVGGGAGGVAAMALHARAMSRNEAGGRPRDERATQADALVSSYTIHHARLGVVHVRQSNGARGGTGALTLRTDDDALRAQLRDAMPALRGALADDDGRGPDVRVDE